MTASRVAFKILFPLILLPGSGTVLAQRQLRGIDLSVRSFWTNYSVPAVVTVRPLQPGVQPMTISTNDLGRVHLNLPSGEYSISISAPGYETMEAKSSSVSGRVLPMVFVLHPLQEPEEVQAQLSLFRPGFALINGWIVDADTGKPIPGVTVHVEGGRAAEQTNDRGYYALSVPAPPSRHYQGVGELPGVGTVIAEHPLYKTFLVKNVLLPDGMDAPMNFELTRGKGTMEYDDRHPLDVFPR
jgi:hypothetical protein